MTCARQQTGHVGFGVKCGSIKVLGALQGLLSVVSRSVGFVSVVSRLVVHGLASVDRAEFYAPSVEKLRSKSDCHIGSSFDLKEVTAFLTSCVVCVVS